MRLSALSYIVFGGIIMPDFDDFPDEPRHWKRKYRVCPKRKRRYDPKRWTVLLSVTSIDEERCGGNGEIL